MVVKSLLVRISADVAGFNSELNNAKKKWSDVTTGMTRIGAGLTAAVTLPLLGVGAASIKMAMSAVESENLFEVSMGGMADAARAWSVDLRKQLGLNEYEVRKNVGVMYSMTSSMGLTKDAAYEVSTGFTKLAYDMASFYNLKPEEAFQKLRSGIAGEVEPLRQLGIMVDENTVKTYAYKNGIAAQGAELTVGQKVMARYGVIMAATSNAQGDLARTIDSPTNKLRVMGEQMKMTATELGMQLLPAFNALLGVGSKIVSGIGSVVKVFSSLPAPVKTVILVLAGVAAAAGPALIVLAKMLPVIRALPSILGMLKSGLIGLINPYTLVAAAAAAFVIISLQVADAQAQAEECTRRNDEVTAKYAQKLAAAAQQAGMTAVEFANLTAKYEGNYAAMGFAIQHGKESVELQQALAKVSKEHGAAIDEQRKKQEAATKAQEEALLAGDKAKASLEAMTQLRATLTDEIARATMSETQYTQYSLDQQYQARVADIQRSAETEKQKYAAMLLARQSYDVQLAAIMAQATADEYAKTVKDRENFLAVQAAANTEYLAMKQEAENQLALLGATGLQRELARIEQEKQAKIQAIMDDKLLSETQKANLLALWTDYYTQLELSLTEHKKATIQTYMDIVDAVAGFLSQLSALSQARKQEQISAIDEEYQARKKAIEDSMLSEEEKAKALQKLDEETAKKQDQVKIDAGRAQKRTAYAMAVINIAQGITAALSGLPPWSFVQAGLVAAAGAVQLATIKATSFAEGGLVTRPTTALIGEKGPEFVVPLKKLGLLGAGAQGRGVTLQQTLHFHGNINSSFSVDEISRILGERTIQAIEKGRRF